LKAFLLALGDDVQLKVQKYYFAFRRIKNFACVEVHPQTMRILLFVKVDPTSIQLEKGFTRDVRNIGHYGTGDLEISIQNDADLERAKPLVLKSYEVSQAQSLNLRISKFRFPILDSNSITDSSLPLFRRLVKSYTKSLHGRIL
jgi:predicted transport protein